VCDPSEVPSHEFNCVYASALFLMSIMYETNTLEHILYCSDLPILYHEMLRFRCLPARRDVLREYWRTAEYKLREMARPPRRSSGQNNTS